MRRFDKSKKEAERLRRLGFSYREISESIKIAKSTASLWTGHIKLSKKAKTRLLKNSLIGLNNSIKTKHNLKSHVTDEINKRTLKEVKKINYSNNIYKLLCSMLYWAEGSKQATTVTFINSDPKMIAIFLFLLRKSFNTDDHKFKALIHIHEYHDELLLKKYWSKVTKIPITNFYKSYKKPHTKKRIKPGYKGSISIRYHDYRIALELRSVYNNLTKILGV